MSVKFDLATDNVDSQGERFSKEALHYIAETAPGLGITLNFDPFNTVGKITQANLVNGRVVAEGILNDAIEEKLYRMASEGIQIKSYVVIGFAILQEHRENDRRVYDSILLLETSLVETPSDLTLRPIFEVKRENK